jgi:hypothetical protein
MNIKEICDELTEYYELLKISDPVNAEDINRNCRNETSSPYNETERLLILRNLLLRIRKIIISNYYIGQLNIKFMQSDHTEKIIVVDIDSSETIAQLKSKIFDIESIEPSRQRLSFSQFMFGSNITHLNDDTSTIASYKIPNQSYIRLFVE